MATIVESSTYVALKAMCMNGDEELMDEIQQGFDLILANNPYHGYPVPGDVDPDMYVFTTTSFPPRIPSFRVLYRYNKESNPDEVELLAIQQLPFDGDE